MACWHLVRTGDRYDPHGRDHASARRYEVLHPHHWPCVRAVWAASVSSSPSSRQPGVDPPCGTSPRRGCRNNVYPNSQGLRPHPASLGVTTGVVNSCRPARDRRRTLLALIVVAPNGPRPPRWLAGRGPPCERTVMMEGWHPSGAITRPRSSPAWALAAHSPIERHSARHQGQAHHGVGVAWECSSSLPSSSHRRHVGVSTCPNAAPRNNYGFRVLLEITGARASSSPLSRG